MKPEPHIGWKSLSIHMRDASQYNLPHEPSFWWWFANALMLMFVVGVGLAFMWG